MNIFTHHNIYKFRIDHLLTIEISEETLKKSISALNENLSKHYSFVKVVEEQLQQVQQQQQIAQMQQQDQAQLQRKVQPDAQLQQVLKYKESQQKIIQEEIKEIKQLPAQQVLEQVSALVEEANKQQDPQNQNRTNQQGQSPPKGYSKE